MPDLLESKMPFEQPQQLIHADSAASVEVTAMNSAQIECAVTDSRSHICREDCAKKHQKQKRSLERLKKHNKKLRKKLKTARRKLAVHITGDHGSLQASVQEDQHSIEDKSVQTMSTVEQSNTADQTPTSIQFSPCTVHEKAQLHISEINDISGQALLKMQELQGIMANLEDFPQQLLSLQKGLKEDLQSRTKSLALSERNKQLEKRYLMLEREKESIEQDLTTCKDDIFRLQPVEPIPESVLIADLDSLCKSLGDWIEVEISEFEHANPAMDLQEIMAVQPISPEGKYLRNVPKATVPLIKRIVWKWMILSAFSDDVMLWGLCDIATMSLMDAQNAMQASSDGTSKILNFFERLTDSIRSQNHRPLAISDIGSIGNNSWLQARPKQ